MFRRWREQGGSAGSVSDAQLAGGAEVSSKAGRERGLSSPGEWLAARRFVVRRPEGGRACRQSKQQQQRRRAVHSTVRAR